MHRSHSCAVLPEKKLEVCTSKSLPNINYYPTKAAPRRKVKILQKTWDKVKTIIHPSSARRNSKQSPVDPDLRTPSPLQKNYPSSSVPSTPNKKLVFDFEPGPSNSSYDGLKFSDDQVVRNYVELQKRLSEELHQSMASKDPRTLSDDFKKRLQQWDMWKASTGKYHYTEEELQKLIPSDFSKKLQEWEELKSKPREEQIEQKPMKKDNRQKELQWLEKQLAKIEVEKARLEREMRKYCEREVRLEKMREALKNSQGKDFWIKTPTAECKVEGVNEKFTKRLYEWEEKQGIQPESSTMALLSPKYANTSSQEAESPAPQEIESELCELDQADNEKGYSSSGSEYEPTDSMAKDLLSGASNTDSDCLKPHRRRSSDGVSTPLSTRSLSACSSEDENWMLKTVNEMEEAPPPEPPPILRVEPIVIDDNGGVAAGSFIVPTKRTLFTPVLVKRKAPDPPVTVPEAIPEPCRVVGAIRKSSNASNFSNPSVSIPLTHALSAPLRDMGRKSTIPVWSSPLSTRKPPNNDFSLDKFLQDTNLIPPLPPQRPSRIPVTSASPHSSRKYTLTPSSNSTKEGKVRLISLTRSVSFQGNRNTTNKRPIEAEVPVTREIPDMIQTSSPANTVVKSKSTGSILGGGGGLFGLKNKLGLRNEQKSLLPAWIRK